MEREREKKKYCRVDCFLRVEEEDTQVFTSRDDALIDLEQSETMFPENRYEIVECNEKGDDLERRGQKD